MLQAPLAPKKVTIRRNSMEDDHVAFVQTRLVDAAFALHFGRGARRSLKPQHEEHMKDTKRTKRVPPRNPARSRTRVP